MSPVPHLSLGDRVHPTVEWMLVPMEEWGTVVDVQSSTRHVVYTVEFDCGIVLRCFGFMVSRLDTERAN